MISSGTSSTSCSGLQLRLRGNGLARMSRVHSRAERVPGRDVMVKVIAPDIHDH